MGGPLPVVHCGDGKVCTPIIGISGTANYESAAKRMIVTLNVQQKSLDIIVVYDERESTLTFQSPKGKEFRLLHRKNAVTPELMEH